MIHRIVAMLLVVLFAWPLRAHGGDEDLERRLRGDALRGRIKRLESLVSDGADVNGQAEYGETALFYAVQFGHTPAVRRLLGLGADPNIADERGRVPLLKAAENCNDHAVEALLSAGASAKPVDAQGRTALIYAAASGCVRIVALLLLRRRGEVDLDARDRFFKTADDYVTHPWIAEMLRLAREREQVFRKPFQGPRFLESRSP